MMYFLPSLSAFSRRISYSFNTASMSSSRGILNIVRRLMCEEPAVTEKCLLVAAAASIVGREIRGPVLIRRAALRVDIVG